MKKSAIDLAIEKLEGEKQVLDLAIAKLKQQQAQAPKKRKASKPVEVARPA
jgi:hypothetical protein